METGSEDTYTRWDDPERDICGICGHWQPNCFYHRLRRAYGGYCVLKKKQTPLDHGGKPCDDCDPLPPISTGTPNGENGSKTRPPPGDPRLPPLRTPKGCVRVPTKSRLRRTPPFDPITPLETGATKSETHEEER